MWRRMRRLRTLEAVAVAVEMPLWEATVAQVVLESLLCDTCFRPMASIRIR
jgi:hypothetical protein